MENVPVGKDGFDSTGLMIYLFKWRKLLLIIFLISLVASLFFSSSLFIAPKFKSTVIMFPVSTSSISRALMSEMSSPNQDITQFGEEEQAEQLLQILNSNKIRDRIVQQFNLMQHYGIDSSSSYKYSRLYRQYENNITFRRTEYMAVKATVLDKDAQMAADIANAIADLVDTVKNQMQKERAWQGYQIVQQEYEQLQDEVNHIVDSLAVIGQMGVNDYERQSEVLNQQMSMAISTNNRTAMAVFQKKLDLIGKYGGTYMALKNALEFKTEQLILLKGKLKEAKVDAEQNITQKFVVNYAYKAEKKSYPVRWLIMVVTVFSALFLGALTLVTIDKIQAIRKSGRY
ncbi:MAG: hypothetical protein FJY10_09985 [Bacteroidetes bacterium]|nr:hypothetical protein [Bacteroidota bacterium]